jgi:hypothetical protein
MAIVAAFDAATPANTSLQIDTVPPIQPTVMIRALQEVDTRLVDGVRMVGHSNERVIPVGRVISHTATFKTTVVGRLVFGIPRGRPGLVFHYVIVAGTKRRQAAAQNVGRRGSHRNPPEQRTPSFPKEGSWLRRERDGESEPVPVYRLSVRGLA